MVTIVTRAGKGSALSNAERDANFTNLNTGLDDKQSKIECLIIAVTDETSVIAAGVAKIKFRMPYAFTVTGVRSSLNDASTSGLVTLDVNEAGTTILSTKLSIDANELISTTAATAHVVSDTTIADFAEVSVDIDAAGTGAKGLKLYLYGYR
jgi:hypothetical protein